jgi:glycosyltransferase involved in cell wall biosynthesis
LAEALWLLPRTRALGVEHLHVHFATDSAVVALLLSQLGGPSYSVTAHAKDIYRATVDYRVLERIVLESAFVVTVCDANRAWLAERLAAPALARVRRLYNGVDLDLFAYEPGPRETNHVLGVGRLVEKKGFDVLVDALALLLARGLDVRASLVGDGEERERVAARIAAHGIGERVRMLGARDQAEVRTLMARATVMCQPCRVGDDGNRDALPTVLLESLAIGLPTVSTPVTGVPEILDHGQAGLLVPEGDAPATADAIQRLLADRALRERLARAGRARAEELFDRRRQARALGAWFDVALEARSCASPA